MARSKSTIVSIVCAFCEKPFEIKLYPSMIAPRKYCAWQCFKKGKIIPIEIRFWRHVHKTESCWLWTGALTHLGYGSFRENGASVLAHRVSWMLTNGPIPDGLDVLHDCPSGDNPACVNPAHLWLGTHTDNMRDMISKGGGIAGIKNQNAKLTDDIVREIRLAHSNGRTTKELAMQLGVSESTARHAIGRRSWKHVA